MGQSGQSIVAPRERSRGFAPILLLLALLVGLMTGGGGVLADDFSLPKVKLDGLKKLTLHISEYHVVHAEPGSEVSLLDPSGKPLGVKISRDDFCEAALQGTVEVSGVHYTVAGRGKKSLVNCALPRYACPRCAAFNLGQNRFVKSMSADGLGSKTYGLIAYRTVAVKQDGLALGTVIFIPAARGLKLPNGKKHDGYFLVADFGAMRSNQIDLFTGTRRLAWRIIGSGTARSKSVAAYIVTDPGVVAPLKAAHVASAKAAAD